MSVRRQSRGAFGSVLLEIVVAAAVALVVAAGMLWRDASGCDALAGKVEHRYELLKGCSVKTADGYVPVGDLGGS